MSPRPAAASLAVLLTLAMLGLDMAISHFAISLQLAVGATQHEATTQIVLMLLYPMAYTFVGVGALAEERWRHRLKDGSGALAMRAAGGVLLVLLLVLLCLGLTAASTAVLWAKVLFVAGGLAAWFTLLGAALSQQLRVLKRVGPRWLAAGWMVHLLGLLVGYLANTTLTMHTGATAVLMCLAVSLIALPRRGLLLLAVLLLGATLLGLDDRLETLRGGVVTAADSRQTEALYNVKQTRSIPPELVHSPAYRAWSPYALLSVEAVDKDGDGRAETHGGYYNFQHQWDVSTEADDSGMELFRAAVYTLLEPEDRAVFIGVGGGRGLSYLGVDLHPGITAVERDPAVVHLLRDQHPELNDHRFTQVTTLAADGRFVAETLPEPVDLVVVESAMFQPPRALVSLTAPYWLYTEESLASMLEAVSPDGLLLINVNDVRARRRSLLEHTRQSLEALGATSSLTTLTTYKGQILMSYLVASYDPDAHARACGLLDAGRQILDQVYTGTRVAMTRGGSTKYPRWGHEVDMTVCTSEVAGRPLPSTQRMKLTDDRPFLGWQLATSKQRSDVTSLGLGTVVASLLAALLVLRVRRPEGSWNPVPYFFLLGLGHTTIQVAAIYYYRSYFGDEVATMGRVISYHLLYGSLGALLVGRLARKMPPRVMGLLVVGACLAFHTLGLYSMPFEQPGAVLRELAAAGLLLPGGVLLGVFFPLGLARVGPGWIGRCLLADGLGVIFAYGALVLVALPCGLTALLTLALVAYTLAATLGWGRGWSQPPPG